jgi:poly(A) polymerase
MEELEALAQQQQLEAGRPPKLLSGHEVMELTGLMPGPEVGRVLNELQEAQLRGLVNTADEARRFVKKLESAKPPTE